ncbi:MAG: pilus assembly protein PilM [Verrucomicrobia bacterium]|nr:pilus assembly protein PilM [Verrucomicrobiota bacterium]
MKPRIQSRLGIAISPRGLEVAEVVTDPGVSLGPRVARREIIPVEPAAEGAPAWPLEKLQPFRPRRGMTAPEVFTGLDSANVLCRVVNLPTINDAELGPMLENQLENLSPLPPEQVVFSYEVIGKTEKQSDVLVAIARRETVMERLESLRQAGLPADAVDVETLALLAWLRHEQALPAAELADMALVVIEDQSATLVLTHAGALQLVSSVPLQGLAGGEPLAMAAAAAGLISGGLRLALAAVQSARPEAAWSCVRVLQRPTAGTPASAELDPQQVATALAAQIGLSCEVLALREAPSIAVGLCLRQSRDGASASRLNLIPADVLAEKQKAVRRQKVKQVLLGAAAIYVLFVLVGAILFSWRYAGDSSLRAQLAELAPARDRARSLQTELKLLQEKVSDQSVPLDCLLEILKAKPENLFLTDFQFVDGEQITLTGYAPTASAVTDDFNQKLEKSPAFPGGTRLAPLLNQKIRGGDAVRFSIQCNLKKGATPTRGGGRRGR